MLTNKEKELLSQIAYDNETGNHLLGRPRPPEYWEMRDELCIAHHTFCPTQKHIEMLEYLHQCTDYEYYNSLPIEKRMF